MPRNFIHTAKSALIRDIKFWESNCHCTREEVAGKVEKWHPFGFGFSEINSAKQAFFNNELFN